MTSSTEHELTVTWTGPYAFPGFETDEVPALPEHGGVYLMTFDHADAFIVYTPGEAINISKRFRDHAREYRNGTYNVLDVDQAQAGVRSVLFAWRGYKKGPAEHAQDPRFKMAVERQLAAMRIFVSNELPKRQRCRLEGAIIRRLYAEDAALTDRNMLAHRAFDHEAAITVLNITAKPLLGLPATLLIDGPPAPLKKVSGR